METYALLCAVLLLVLVIFAATRMLLEALTQITESFKQSNDTDSIDLNAIKEELLDIVEDTINNLQPPNAFDHIMGALAQFAQHKLMAATGITPDSMAALQDGLNDLEGELIS